MRFSSIKKYLPYAALVIMPFAFYFLYLNQHFATDTYTDLPNLEDVTRGALNNGRFVNLAFVLLMRLLGINYVSSPTAQFIVNFLAICCLGLAACLFYRFIEKRFELSTAANKFVAVLSCGLIFCNPFFCDIFQFSECVFGFMLGLPLAVAAAGIMSDFDAPVKKRVGVSVILIVIVAGSYQPFLNYYMILYVILYMLKLNERLKIKEFIMAAAVYAAGALSGFLLLKIMNPGANRVMQNLDIIKNIEDIINTQKPLLIDSFTLIPSFIFITVLLIIFICGVFTARKNSALLFLFVFASIFIYLVNFALFLPTSQGQFWPSPRTLTSFMGIPGGFALLYLSLPNKKYKYSAPVIAVCLSSLLCFYLYSTIQTADGLLYTNKKDREEVEFYAGKITEYENSTGTTVTKASFAYDISPTPYYNEVMHTHDLNMRAYYRSWARKPFLDYVTGKDLTNIQIPEDIYNKYFAGKNWDSLSEEQIVIEGDTVFIIVY